MANSEGPLPLATRSLALLDLPAWHDLPDYNDDVRTRLYACQRALLVPGTPLESYAEIYQQLGPIRHADMCDPQRIRVNWLLAMAFAGVEDHLQALQVLDAAVLLASDEDDQDALADLLDLRGSLNVYVARFQEAQEDFSDAAAMYQDARLPGEPGAQAIEQARLLRQHADTLYLLAQPRECADALNHARALLRRAPHDTEAARQAAALQTVAIEYSQAHLHRIFGNPSDALLPALHAASYFSEQDEKHTNTAARTHVFSAEIALDLVERMEATGDRDAFLHLARAHLVEGHRLAQQVELKERDGASGLARLCEQRLARLTEGAATHAAAREQAIQQVLRLAEERDDLLLLAQAHTTLADDLAAQARMSEAVAHYERAIQVVARTQAPVLAIPARRALHQYHEAHPSPFQPDTAEQDDAANT